MNEHLLKQKLTDCEKALTAAERERDELKATLKVHEDELAGSASGATRTLIQKLTAERDHYQKSNTTQGRLFSAEYDKREALEAKLAKCADFADTVDKDLKVAGEPNAEVHTRISHQFVGLLKAYREQREKTDALKTALKECVEALSQSKAAIIKLNNGCYPMEYCSEETRYRWDACQQIEQALAKAKEVL